MKKVGEITVNDGNGFYDNEGLCDTLIMDCNNLTKSLVSGQYIQFSSIVVQMVTKLKNLKSGIAADLESKDKIIEELQRQNADLTEQKTGITVDREG